jgi:hypothetical protein
LASWDCSPSFKLKFGINFLFSVSGHSLWRWLPPHDKHQGGCLQLAQKWLKFWQL